MGKDFPLFFQGRRRRCLPREAHHLEVPATIPRTGLESLLLIMRVGRFRKLPQPLLLMPALLRGPHTEAASLSRF